jgi:hypothetical protein
MSELADAAANDLATIGALMHEATQPDEVGYRIESFREGPYHYSVKAIHLATGRSWTCVATSHEQGKMMCIKSIERGLRTI